MSKEHESETHHRLFGESTEETVATIMCKICHDRIMSNGKGSQRLTVTASALELGWVVVDLQGPVCGLCKDAVSIVAEADILGKLFRI